jgi:NDP-sugar pyrophosphorylase family protein
MFEEHFGRGDRWGVNIEYLREDHELGTAGSLSLLPRTIDQPVLIMNGDVLTKVNFSKLLEFHDKEHAEATMCIREYDLQVPFGVVMLDGHEIRSVREKPVHRFFVNSGIYVLNPDVVRSIEPGCSLDMPSLFEQLMQNGSRTTAFPLREYWLDIGQLEDFRRAEGEFERIFGGRSELDTDPEETSG